MTKFIRVIVLLIASAIFGIATASAGTLDPRLANLVAGPAPQVRSLPEAFSCKHRQILSAHGSIQPAAYKFISCQSRPQLRCPSPRKSRHSAR